MKIKSIPTQDAHIHLTPNTTHFCAIILPMVQYPEIKTSTNITIFNEQISLFGKALENVPK